jgi:hypothetical protein
MHCSTHCRLSRPAVPLPPRPSSLEILPISDPLRMCSILLTDRVAGGPTARPSSSRSSTSLSSCHGTRQHAPLATLVCSQASPIMYANVGDAQGPKVVPAL